MTGCEGGHQGTCGAEVSGPCKMHSEGKCCEGTVGQVIQVVGSFSAAGTC